MANIDLLSSPEGRAFVADVAQRFGLEPGAAAAAVGGLIPDLVNGLERNTLSRGGLADLLKALASGSHDGYLGAPSILNDPAIMADGTKILGHIFRSESSARRATRFVESETGVSRNILWQILPGLAALLLGWLAKSASGGLGDVLSKLPGGAALPGNVGAPSFPPSFPKSGGDWAAPKAGGSASVPKSGGDLFPPTPDLDKLPRSGPYGDLSDILKRGGRGTGSLASVIRNIIGGLLGFGSKGIVGWIIRLILVRYGWRILGWVVRRIFVRR